MPRARISRCVFGVLCVLFGVLTSLCAERAEIVACARPRTRNLPGLLARRTPRTRPCPCYPRFAHATHALPSLPACNSPVPGLYHSRNVRKSHGAPLLSRFHFRFSICQLHQRSPHVPTDQTTPVGSAVPMPPRDHAFLGACGRFFLFTVVFQSFDLKKKAVLAHGPGC